MNACAPRRIGFLLALSLIAPFTLAGCERPTPIKELAAQPAKYKGQEVRISGRVVSNYSLQPLTQKSIYVVSDGTGQMSVIASGGAPATNSEVTVAGTLQDVPPFALPVVGKFDLAPIMIEEKERQVAENK